MSSKEIILSQEMNIFCCLIVFDFTGFIKSDRLPHIIKNESLGLGSKFHDLEKFSFKIKLTIWASNLE